MKTSSEFIGQIFVIQGGNTYFKSESEKINLFDMNTMLCPIKVNSNTIELTSCYCILDLLCVKSDNYACLIDPLWEQ